MSPIHTLAGRTQAELLWTQRRSFLQAAALWSAMGGYTAAFAQGRSNIVDLMGDVLLNGQRLLPGQVIQTGDEIITGPMSTLVFVLGNSSFLVRQNTRMVVERGSSLSVVSVLRMLTGAVASVWGKGTSRRIVTPDPHGRYSWHRCVHRSIPPTGQPELFLQLLRHSGHWRGYRNQGQPIRLPPVFLGRGHTQEWPLVEPSQSHQPHRRGTGILGTSGRPTHQLANSGAQRHQKRHGLHG